MLNHACFHCCIALLAGSLCVLAFAPFNFYPFALLGPLLLLWTWLQASRRQALAYGALFGLGMFGVGVYWVYISIHQYGNTAAPLAVLLSALFVMLLALYPALQGYCFVRFFRHRSVALGFACTWVFAELLRSTLFTGLSLATVGLTAKLILPSPDLSLSLATMVSVLSPRSVQLCCYKASDSLNLVTACWVFY